MVETPEEFNALIHEGLTVPLEEQTARRYFPDASEEFFRVLPLWSILERNVRTLLEERLGSRFPCGDGAGWLVWRYLRLISQKQRENTCLFREEERCMYCCPPFGTPDQWLDFCNHLCLLAAGNPDGFSDAWNALRQTDTHH